MYAEKNPSTGRVVDLFGPTIEFLTGPEDEQNDFCMLKGTIPPGTAIPLHSHADTEDFILLSGTVQFLRASPGGHEWISARPGDYIHVPRNARHAWRNNSAEPVTNLIITTKRLARFLLEAGRPTTLAGEPPTSADLDRFARLSAQYGYWNASPEENCTVGIGIPPGSHS